MARTSLALCFTLLILLIAFNVSTSADPTSEPPASPPEADAPTLSPSPEADAPGSPSPDISSPPAPPPSDGDDDDQYPSPSPTPSPEPSDDPEADEPEPYDGPEADAPEPEAKWANVKDDVKPKEKEVVEAEGMSGGKKAGIVLGAFAFVGLAALGGLVYKKRKENIERASYGYAVRRELL